MNIQRTDIVLRVSYCNTNNCIRSLSLQFTILFIEYVLKKDK